MPPPRSFERVIKFWNSRCTFRFERQGFERRWTPLALYSNHIQPQIARLRSFKDARLQGFRNGVDSAKCSVCDFFSRSFDSLSRFTPGAIYSNHIRPQLARLKEMREARFQSFRSGVDNVKCSFCDFIQNWISRFESRTPITERLKQNIPLITALVVGAIVVNIALFMYLESTRGREIDWLQFNYKYLRRGKVEEIEILNNEYVIVHTKKRTDRLFGTPWFRVGSQTWLERNLSELMEELEQDVPINYTTGSFPYYNRGSR